MFVNLYLLSLNRGACKPFKYLTHTPNYEEQVKIYIYIHMYVHTHTRVCVLSHFSLCDPMDRSPPSSSVHGILQARILEWLVMPSSRGSSQSRDQTCISYVSCTGRQALYHYCHLGSLIYSIYVGGGQKVCLGFYVRCGKNIYM